MTEDPISHMEWMNLLLAQRRRSVERSYAQPAKSYRDPADSAQFESEREAEIKLQAKGK